MRMPPWLLQSWWLDRGWTLGNKFARQHRTANFAFSLLLCSGLAVAACIQVGLVWPGPWSALALVVGALVAAAALLCQRRHLRRPGPFTAAVLKANTLVGGAVGAAFVAGFIVPHPTPALAALIVSGDGYVAVLFLSLIPVMINVRRRRAAGG